MNQHKLLNPFTAARLERASDEERNAELRHIGIRFLRRNKLLAWDGRDTERAFELATIAYDEQLRSIAAARRALERKVSA